MRIEISGHSDDTIHIDGAIPSGRDSVDCFGDPKPDLLFVAPDGASFVIRPHYDGEWRFQRITEKLPGGWGYENCARAHEYSEQVVLTAPEWTEVYIDRSLCGSCGRPQGTSEDEREQAIEYASADLYCWGKHNCKRGQRKRAGGAS